LKRGFFFDCTIVASSSALAYTFDLHILPLLLLLLLLLLGFQEGPLWRGQYYYLFEFLRPVSVILGLYAVLRCTKLRSDDGRRSRIWLVSLERHDSRSSLISRKYVYRTSDCNIPLVYSFAFSKRAKLQTHLLKRFGECGFELGVSPACIVSTHFAALALLASRFS